MPPRREFVLPHDHDVTIYDADGDLVDELTEFVTDGLALGEAVILVATPEHRTALGASLALAGCPVDDAVTRGQLHIHDAAETLAAFLRDGSPDEELFFAVIGSLLDRVGASGRPIRVFGEMVALLWDDSNVHAAIDLESLWNRLGRMRRFSLLCGYSTSALSDPGDLTAMRAVCDHHSEVLAPASYEAGDVGPITPTGTDETRIFIATPPAVRAVRHLVVDTLRAWGQDALVPDAALLVSELATNAVRHASSPFRASVSRGNGTVRIAVEDLGTSEPHLRPADLERLGGRGVALVDAMSLSWGVDPAPVGKVVWCELPMTEDRLAG
jgi:anti-sigma regulatory factor (Ser/Thr protein kinase)